MILSLEKWIILQEVSSDHVKTFIQKRSPQWNLPILVEMVGEESIWKYLMMKRVLLATLDKCWTTRQALLSLAVFLKVRVTKINPALLPQFRDNIDGYPLKTVICSQEPPLPPKFWNMTLQVLYLFSCEGAALEVLMSVCLCVCLCVLKLKFFLFIRFLKVSKGS